jgi:hypothetical protein
MIYLFLGWVETSPLGWPKQIGFFFKNKIK